MKNVDDLELSIFAMKFEKTFICAQTIPQITSTWTQEIPQSIDQIEEAPLDQEAENMEEYDSHE